MADVFISYAREDQDFVRKLQNALEERKRNSWIDLENIPLTAKWLEEVYAGIESAHTFAFVISKDSIDSDFCRLELAHAVQNNKRLAPIWHRDVEEEAVPHELASHQYIFFRDSDDFEDAFRKLIEALDTDLEWVHEHTWLLMRAKEWDSKSRDGSLLLRGRDLKAAQVLQAREVEKAEENPEFEPTLNDLQKDYILASRRATTRSRLMVLGTVVFVLTVVVLAAYAFWERHEANLQRTAAEARGLAGQAQLMSNQGSESLRTGVLFAAVAKDKLVELGLPSMVADGVLRSGVNLLARPGPGLVHQMQVYAVAYSPDGKYVATAGDDGARLWDANSGEEVAPPLKSDRGTTNVVFSPDGKYVATASADGTARVWKVPSGEKIATFEHDAAVSDVAFDPDSELLATTDGMDKAAYVWNIAHDGKDPRRYELLGPGSRVAFGPSGKYLATASLSTEDSGNLAQVWNLEKRREVARVKHEDVISRLVFSPDGKYLATASADRTARVWEAKSGEEVSRVEHDGSVTDLDFGPDGKRLATASFDGTARLWDVQSGDQIANFEHDSTVNDIAFGPDGKQLGTASLDTAHVWEIATGLEIARMSHLDKIARVALSPDGEHVATASYDHTVRLWDVSDSEVTSFPHDESSVNGVSFSPDGRYLATAGTDHSARIWDIRSGESIERVEHRDVVDGLTFSPDGKLIATASSDNTARVWDASTGKRMALMKHDAGVYGGIAFSPDGERLATASADGIAHVWNVESGEEVQSFQHTIYGGVYSADFSPDGERLATAGSDGAVRIWDIATGDAVGQVIPQMTHDREIWDVAFSPGGEYLALAGMDGTVWLWDLAGEEIEGEPMRHQGPVASLNFSSDGGYLATASYDHTARVWEVPSTEEVARLNHDDSLNGIAFSPDGERLATASADGIARLESWRPQRLIKEACSRLTHNLSEGEWRQYVGGPYKKTCPELPVSQDPALGSPAELKNGGPTSSRLSGGEELAGVDSIRTSHTADSTNDACGDTVTYDPKNAVDGKPVTAWRVSGTGVREWIELTYDKPLQVSRVGIIPGYDKIDPCDGTDRFHQNYVIKKAKIEFSDGSSVEESFQKKPQMQFVDVPNTETSSVRITVLDTYPPANNSTAAPYSSTYKTAAISEIKVEQP